ncbi:hypothetical protein ABLN97_12240 [Mycobacterium tuberculosis]
MATNAVRTPARPAAALGQRRAHHDHTEREIAPHGGLVGQLVPGHRWGRMGQADVQAKPLHGAQGDLRDANAQQRPTSPGHR